MGATVRDGARLPEHLAADEHHTDWCGQKGYVAVTAGGGCLLGVALSDSADEAHLTDAYGQFAREARHVDPQYQPQTVNTDGWFATSNAFAALFSTIVPILCFLHGFLKIRERGRKAHDLHARIWEVYRAATPQNSASPWLPFVSGSSRVHGARRWWRWWRNCSIAHRTTCRPIRIPAAIAQAIWWTG